MTRQWSLKGVVVVSGNRQTVQHRDGGIISRLAVREGDQVQQGQILIELGATEVVAQARGLLSQVVDLQMQRARLTAEQTAARKQWSGRGVGELDP